MHSTDCSLQFYTFLDNKTDKIPGTGLTLILQIIAITWPVVKKTSTTTSFKVLCASETTLLLEILTGILTSEGYSGSWRGDGRAQSRHLPESSSRKNLASLSNLLRVIICEPLIRNDKHSGQIKMPSLRSERSLFPIIWISGSSQLLALTTHRIQTNCNWPLIYHVTYFFHIACQSSHSDPYLHARTRQCSLLTW